MIRDYASDRVGPYWESTAPLINSLQFSQQERVDHPLCFYPVRTRVECDWHLAYFMAKSFGNNYGWSPSDMLEFHHEQFDERNFPQHFDISLFWPNSREQDEIEAMGAEDGMPASLPPAWWWWSATVQDAPAVDPLQWTRVGEGKWVSQPVSSPPRHLACKT